MLTRLILFGLVFCSLSFNSYACAGKASGSIGDCAPQFSLTTQGDQRVSLSSYTNKVLIVHFWATWCQPCAEELASLNSFYKKLDVNRFALLTIALDAGGKSVLDSYFAKIFKGVWPLFPIALDGQKKVAKAYSSFKVPETYVIDRSGRIRLKIVGAREWDDALTFAYLDMLSAN